MKKIIALLLLVTSSSNIFAQQKLYHFIDTKGTILKSFYITNNLGYTWYEKGQVIALEKDMSAFVQGKKNTIENLNFKNIFPSKNGYYTFSNYNASIGKAIKGLIDSTGKEIISGEFENIAGVAEGLICFEKGHKTGFMDVTGKVIIEPIYEKHSASACSFNNGLALVKLGNKFGYINKTGKVIIPINYDNAYAFNEGIAIVIKGEEKMYINTEGKVIVKSTYKIADNFCDGLAAVGNDNNNCGFIDKTGKIVIPLIYQNAYPFKFSEGLAAMKKDGKWGYINKQGQVIIPFTYNSAGNFYNGLAAVNENSYINIKNEIIIKTENWITTDFYNGVALVEDKNTNPDLTKLVAINNNTTNRVKNTNPDVTKLITINNNIGTNNTAINKITTKVETFDVKIDNYTSNQKAQNSVNLKVGEFKYWNETFYGFKDENDNFLIEPIFRYAYDFSEGLGGVEFIEGGSGYVNTAGKIVIEFKNRIIKSLSPFYNGIAKIVVLNSEKNDWEEKYIDKTGKEVNFTGVYDEAMAKKNAIPNKPNFIKFKKSYQEGYTDNLGVEIVKPIYQFIETYINGYAIAKEEKCGVIDMSGNIIIPFNYQTIRRYPGNTFVCETSKSYELIDLNNKQIIKGDFHFIRYMGVNNLFEIQSANTKKYGVLDSKTGNVTIDPTFDAIIGRYSAEKDFDYYSSQYFVGYNGKKEKDFETNAGGRRALIGIKGNQLTGSIYSYIQKYSREGMVVATLPNGDDFAQQYGINQRYGLLDIENGKQINNSFNAYIGNFTNGTLLVGDLSKYGVINKQGNYIIPQKYNYNEIGRMSDSLLALKTNGKWCYINNLGKTVITAQFQNALDFKSGVALVQLNDKWHYINKLGKIVSTKQYDTIDNYSKEKSDYNYWDFYAVLGSDRIEGKLENGKFKEINKGIVSGSYVTKPSVDIKITTKTAETPPQVKWILEADANARKQISLFNIKIPEIANCLKYYKRSDCQTTISHTYFILEQIIGFAKDKINWVSQMNYDQQKKEFGQLMQDAFEAQLRDVEKVKTDLDAALKQPSLLDAIIMGMTRAFGSK